MLAGPVARSRARLQRDLKDPGAAWDWLHNQITERTVDPVLVHGVCPPNAYLSLRPGGLGVSPGNGPAGRAGGHRHRGLQPARRTAIR